MPLPIKRVARRLPRLMLVACAASVVHAQAPSLDDNGPPPRMKSIQDEVGYAGIMPGGGQDMASGELPGDSAILAMHRTMPSPGYAEVTSLATGRTILVRIAGQSVFAKDRLIDLSCGAARQLGLTAMPAPIRIRHVNPPQQEQAILNAGNAAAERLASPPGLLSALRRKLPAAPRPVGQECGLAASPSAGAANDRESPPITARPALTPKPATTAKAVEPVKPARVAAEKPAPPSPRADVKPVAPAAVVPPKPKQPEVAKGPGFAVQVAALSNRSKANDLAKSLGGYVVVAGGISRVRTGPYATQAAAKAALPQIRAKGFADARVITNEGR